MSTIPSLALIPSGYKASKVYSVLPTDGSGDLTFTRALDTATRVRPDGLIEGVGANVPRLDYLGGGCPKLLLEPQRTNNLQRSEEFDNAFWVNNGVTITANQITSPSGTLTADLLIGVSGGFGIVRFSTWTATNKVASCFAKKGSTNVFRIANISGSIGGVNFDLNTGTVVSVSSGFVGFIEEYPNEWYRCTAIDTLGRIGTLSLGVTAASESVYIWGAQIEAGTNSSSYIPTIGAAVTRSADAASKTGISALIGQTEGTLFLEIDAKVFSQMPTSSEHRMTMVSDDTNNNRILVDFIVTSGGVRRIGVNVISGNVSQANLIFNTAVDKVYKIATAYKTNDFTLFVDGVERATDVSGVTFSGTTLSRLDVGQDRSGTLQQSNPIAQALLFKNRLTNAQLAELTTL